MARKPAGESKRKKDRGPARVHGRIRSSNRPSRSRAGSGARAEDREPKEPETQLRVGGHELRLERYPMSADPTLRAWSAAEEHLLSFLGIGEIGNEAAASTETFGDDPILVLGDPHGAFSTVLAATSGRRIVRWTDSHLATLALRKNLAANGLDPDRVEVVTSSSDPGSLGMTFSTVALLVPKALALLEYQIEWMKGCLADRAQVLAAGMTRHLSPKTRAILEARLGRTEVSRVWKKSVVFRTVAEELEVDEESLTPSFYELDPSPLGPQAWSSKTDREEATIGVPGTNEESGAGDASGVEKAIEPADPSEPEDDPGAHDGLPRVFSFPGVFGGGRLDHGTALLLACLPDLEEGSRTLDLGCGSGVIGLYLTLRSAGVRLTLVDESHLAVASARLTFEENGLPVPEIRVADGCEGIEPGSFDLVVSNPPFHAQHALTVEEATRLFTPVRNVLRPGGEFYVVGAHGVDYGPTLKRFFSEVERIRTDRRYAVHRCRKGTDAPVSPAAGSTD